MYRIYRNLHKSEYTVQHYIKGVGWRKLFGAKNISCINVKFKIYESGRQRVISEKKKNVHAFVIADDVFELDTCNQAAYNRVYEHNPRKVTYNPYKYNSFVYANTGSPIETCDYAIMSDHGIICG